MNQNLIDDLDKRINYADRVTDIYQGLSWAFAFIIAVVGVVVAADVTIASEHLNLLLGAIMAGLAALQKGIEPAKSAEFHRIRKRALELIHIEAERTEIDPSPWTDTQLKRLATQSKINPIQVLESIVQASMVPDEA